ncbi:PEP-CTERM sorting domain-containing protein [Trichocoleus sp. FACHB-262]|uniref:PEP-CTERM sorting domain-containing protein n=1 Tax=Trichocoleus sp. FACHB-262 TaxID=2692869 RepID=UPI0016869189|nr:PEP-CTERM sorting domain-containing protein [Trichocoleus sp. FACHB-262]MBD2124434.1 PEP-CTERM sorting domain-containing protein [Trichocoleus sp. FACHB-262]
MQRFFTSIATIAAGLTFGAHLLQVGSAQAASFYDFNIQWTDNTITTGWFQMDDTPDFQDQYQSHDGTTNYSSSYNYWDVDSLLDISFIHEGTTYVKSDINYIGFYHYDFPAGVYQQPYSGNSRNHLIIGLGNQDSTLYAIDYGADGSPAIYRDSGSEYRNNYGLPERSATAVSIRERSAQAVPEPATIVGLALTGVGVAASRRKQQRQTAA